MTLGGEGRFAAMGNVQVEEARRLVEICIDAGVNLFDTADMYSNGRSEAVLGRALGTHRKEIVLATKVFNRLEPDYIDIYQSHGFDSYTPLEETLRAYDDLIRAGKVRYIGCSNYAGWQVMKELATSERLGIS